MEKQLIEALIQQGRNSMKMPIEDPKYQTDQDLKLAQPLLAKPAMRSISIDLPIDFDKLPIENDFLKIINTRQSVRSYSEEKVSLLELSYLLWCTQGVKEIRGQNYATIRTVPCGGARHQFETYMILQNVEGLSDGYYHYLPLSHKIEFLSPQNDLKPFISKALGGQAWGAKANINFFYSVVAYRCEWRYGIYAHRVALIDAGHISQNMYLALTSIGLGGCGVGYLNEALLHEAFELDGKEEFIFYAFPAGKRDKNLVVNEKDPYAFIR
jgi:SagB-type dehydrogenase family enzyme